MVTRPGCCSRVVVTLPPDTTACSTTTPTPPVCAVRVIEATELLALDVFNAGGRQITLGDVEHYLHELRGHVDECRCGRCAAAAMSTGRSPS